MQMLKYRAVGSDVQAVEVTAKNVLDVAELTGGTHYVSPRTEEPYVVLQTPTGAARADLGTFVVQHGPDDEPAFRVLDADAMASQYARP